MLLKCMRGRVLSVQTLVDMNTSAQDKTRAQRLGCQHCNFFEWSRVDDSLVGRYGIYSNSYKVIISRACASIRMWHGFDVIARNKCKCCVAELHLCVKYDDHNDADECESCCILHGLLLILYTT